MIMYQCFPGQCVDGVNSFTCKCDRGHTGSRCEVELNPCLPDPCYNQAYCCWYGRDWCSTSMPPGYFECYCRNGYVGMILINIIWYLSHLVYPLFNVST